MAVHGRVGVGDDMTSDTENAWAVRIRSRPLDVELALADVPQTRLLVSLERVHQVVEWNKALSSGTLLNLNF